MINQKENHHEKIFVATGIIFLALVLPGSAFAHVTVQPQEAVQGSFSRFVVRAPNERPDASTIKVEIQFRLWCS